MFVLYWDLSTQGFHARNSNLFIYSQPPIGLLGYSEGQYERGIHDAPRVLDQDPEAVVQSEVDHMESKAVADPSDYGLFENQLDELHVTSKNVIEWTYAFGILKTVNFFGKFYSRRFAIVSVLRRLKIPEFIIAQIDEFMNGENGAIDELSRALRLGLED
jgi:hypothetical protein